MPCQICEKAAAVLNDQQLVAGGHMVKNCESKWLSLVKGGCIAIPKGSCSNVDKFRTIREQIVEDQCSCSIQKKGHAVVCVYDSAVVQAVTDSEYTFIGMPRIARQQICGN